MSPWRHLRDTGFHDYVVHDLLGTTPGIASRAMFGGWAIYQHGRIFAIIADGELYFKVDDLNRGHFKQVDSHPFVYARGNHKPTTMSYWLVPEAIMEDEDALREWVEEAVLASKRSKK